MDSSGIHLQTQRQSCRTPAESEQQYLITRKEYTEPCKLCMVKEVGGKECEEDCTWGWTEAGVRSHIETTVWDRGEALEAVGQWGNWSVTVWMEWESHRQSLLQPYVPWTGMLDDFSGLVDPNFCDPTDYSMPGFPIHHQLPELTQTHVHRVGDAIQPSHPLLLLPSILPSIRVFSNGSVFPSGGQSIGASAWASVPASSSIPKSKLPVIPGIFWLPTFAF